MNEKDLVFYISLIIVVFISFFLAYIATKETSKEVK